MKKYIFINQIQVEHLILKNILYVKILKVNININNMMYKSYENLDTFELFVPESF